MIVSLGLDISATGTGVVFLGKQKGSKDLVTLFADQIPPAKAPKLGRWERVDMVGSQVAALIERHPPSVVAVEGYGQVHHGGVQSFAKVVEVAAIVKLVLWSSGLVWHEVPPPSLKKFTTGSGKLPSGASGKKVMIRHVEINWGFATTNHNIADAYALAAFGLAKHGAISCKPHQLDALEGVSGMGGS